MSAPPTFAFLPENLVGQFLNAYPASVDWFRSNRLSPETHTEQSFAACFGDRTTAQLVDLALAVRLDPWQGDANAVCGGAGLDELVDHLVDVHHGPTRAELGRFAVLADHLHRHDPAPEGGWFAAFDRLRRHLLAHLAEEEACLFPHCQQLDRALDRRTITSEACDHELVVMEHGHGEVDRELCELREHLAGQGFAPEHAAYAMALRTGLDLLAADLAIHGYKEEEYLLPAMLHADELYDSRSRARTRRDD